MEKGTLEASFVGRLDKAPGDLGLVVCTCLLGSPSKNS